MATYTVSAPFNLFYDSQGQPLDNGYLYIGAAGSAAESSPISVYWDAALQYPAAQPLRTINGYPSRYGSPSQLFIMANECSITIKDRHGVVVFAATNFVQIESLLTANNTWSGSNTWNGAATFAGASLTISADLVEFTDEGAPIVMPDVSAQNLSVDDNLTVGGTSVFNGAAYFIAGSIAASGSIMVVSAEAGQPIRFTVDAGNFDLEADGQLLLPDVEPVLDNHAARKKYVDDAVATIAGTATIKALGSVDANGTLVAGSSGIDSVVKGGTGAYTIALSSALTSSAKGVAFVTAKPASPSTLLSVIGAYPNVYSTTGVDIWTYQSNAAAFGAVDCGFNIVVYELP